MTVQAAAEKCPAGHVALAGLIGLGWGANQGSGHLPCLLEFLVSKPGEEQYA
jgi:hypothetical protein